MKDIVSREDIGLLVKEFYKKVRKNETLGYIFDDVMKINWDYHMPILIDFWETILLDASSYRRNAMAVHFEVNQKIKLKPAHFITWLSYLMLRLMNISGVKKHPWRRHGRIPSQLSWS